MSPLKPSGDGAAPKPETDATEQNGRDTGGKFTAGNSHGRGNPFKRQVGKLRAALLDTVTEDDIREVAAKLLDLAKRGDLAACKLLLAYTLGTPDQVVDPDRVDLDELEMKQRWPFWEEGVKLVLGKVPPEVVSDFINKLASQWETTFPKAIVGKLDRAEAMKKAGLLGQ